MGVFQVPPNKGGLNIQGITDGGRCFLILVIGDGNPAVGERIKHRHRIGGPKPALLPGELEIDIRAVAVPVDQPILPACRSTGPDIGFKAEAEPQFMGDNGLHLHVDGQAIVLGLVIQGLQGDLPGIVAGNQVLLKVEQLLVRVGITFLKGDVFLQQVRIKEILIKGNAAEKIERPGVHVQGHVCGVGIKVHHDLALDYFGPWVAA